MAPITQNVIARCLSSRIRTAFASAVQSVWRVDAPNLNVCPDTCEGLISCLASLNEFRHDYIEKCRDSNVGNIVVILESPHQEEFRENSFGRIGPASGETGRRIRSYISEYFEHRLDEHTLALVNVVQYQCSIGQLHTREEHKKKNMIVGAMIDDDGVKECLHRRLRMFDFGRDIFLVACGKFKRKRLGIDQVVCSLLQDFGCQKVVALGYHPSRWPRFNNRESKVIKTLKSERMRLKL